jgi:hypothetical protein
MTNQPKKLVVLNDQLISLIEQESLEENINQSQVVRKALKYYFTKKGKLAKPIKPRARAVKPIE